MTSAQITMLVLLAVTFVVWVVRYVITGRVNRTQKRLRPGGEAPLPPNPPRLTIIVPAKDEQANIAACLQGLLNQDYPNFEVLVVDDRSTDRTAEIVGRMAAADPRLRLMQITALPAGWYGKTHAMVRGAAEATGDWLLFVDADCRHEPGSLSAALGYMLQDGADMLSLWPRLEMVSFGENLVGPLCGSVLAIYFQPRYVNDPRRRTAFANGQFVLIRRSVYQAIDGHTPVRGCSVEDIAFARHVKGHGYRILCALGQDVFTTRMYTGFRSSCRGWARIFSGAFVHAWSLAPAILLLAFSSMLPYIITALAATLAWRAGWRDGWWNGLLGFGLAEIGVMWFVMAQFYRLARADARYVVFHPLAVAAALGVMTHALAIRLGLTRIKWRGTVYERSVDKSGTSVK